jgi:tetratricopeptide (TPR) repeat protein
VLNHKFKFVFFSLLLFLCVLKLTAQNKELGYQFFSEQKYTEAIEELEKVYKTNTEQRVYETLLQSYIFLNKYNEGLKLVDKQLRNHSQNQALNVDKIHLLVLKKDVKSADKTFKELIKNFPDNQFKVIEVGNKLLAYKYYTWLEEYYTKGAKVLKEMYSFSFELAELYFAQQKYDMMITSLLSALNYGDDYLEAVQNAISTYLYDDSDGSIKQIIFVNIQKKIQSHPNSTALLELLTWMYLQDLNFNRAYDYAIALDKRNAEQGKRIFDLANVARNNLQFDIAITAYNYLIENKDNFYHRLSKIELVKVLKQKVESKNILQENDIVMLRMAYEKALKELGLNEQTAELQIDYATILAFHIKKNNDALNLLDDVLKNSMVKPQEKAQAKLVKGDILLFTGDVWESVLLYGQVYSDYKNDAIGFDAKFKTAKAYYYTGDFKWAKTQLDVLKGATHKLIANDAIGLSILISDNLATDTIEEPLKLFAEADYLFYQKLYLEALEKLRWIPLQFPNHSTLLDDVFYLKAKIYVYLQKYNEAIESLNNAVAQDDLLVDESLMFLAEIYANYLNQNDKALECFEKVLTDFEDSVFTNEARTKYRLIRGK